MAGPGAPIPRATARALEAWLRGLAVLVRPAIAAAVALGFGNGLLLVGQMWLLAAVMADAVVAGRGLSAEWPRLQILLAVFVSRALLGAGAQAAAFEAGARVSLTVREQLQAHLMALGPAWMRGQRTGAIATTLVDGVEALGRYHAGYLPQMALSAAVPLAVLVAAFARDWVSGLIMLLTAPLIPLFMVLIGKGTEALNSRQWRKLARLGAQLFDSIEGLTTLKIFGASRREMEVLAAVSEDYRESTMAVLRVAFLSSLALEFFATLGIAMVAVYVGLRLFERELAFQPGLFVLLLAPEFYRPLRAMGTQYHARMEAIGAAEAVLALLRTPPPSAPPHPLILPAGPVTEVRFVGVGFAYDDGLPVLHGVDLTLRRGESVALLGASGAGKSTIGQLLLGFARPNAGRILVDGVDLADVAPDNWTARVAWLPQRPTLFRGTVLDNIRLAHADASMSAVERAVEAAGARDLVAALPEGYDTLLGEGGQGLSGGERQRIALARLFLKDADVAVIDEPTAGLDAATAAHVAAAITRLASRCAVLVIAHRPDTVRGADRALVLDEGRIVESGRPGDLLARDGRGARSVEVGVLP